MPLKNVAARREYDNEWKRKKRAGEKGDEVRAYHREYIKQWRADHPQKDWDYREGTEARQKETGHIYYESHKEQELKRHKEYYQEHKEYFQQKSREHYFKNKDKVRQRQQTKRLLVIKHYGGQCACCGESRIEFLVIDHIMNDGFIQRKQIKTNLFDWIVKNDFPGGFQVLCYNCNMAKAFYGECPHKTGVVSKC